MQSWLKPGGKLLISDYCGGEKPWTATFEAYVKQRGYVLYTPSQYGEVRNTAGLDYVCLSKDEAALWGSLNLWSCLLLRDETAGRQIVADYRADCNTLPLHS